jgi:hypothetical protein
MFWALFGLGNTDDSRFESNKNGKYKSALLTEILCFFLYSLYRVATVIFLLNMLIASMTQSYERIFVINL